MPPKKKPANAVEVAAPATVAPGPRRPLVFISHDSRDAELAEAFGNLLTDASGGTLKSFRSSDRKGDAGITFGAEWYQAIMNRLDEATEVVALVTPASINRPWILYEAGVAKGKLATIVFGVAVDVPLQDLSVGPFAQFQNCDSDEDSLTKLVLQLVRKVPDAAPREEAVRLGVRTFRGTVEELVKKAAVKQPAPARPDDAAVAKLFEEIKILFRELPDQVEGRLKYVRGSRKRRRFHPMMLERMLFHPGLREGPGSPAVAWLMAISMFKDDFPWIYEIGLDAYRALRKGDRAALSRARSDLRSSSHALMDSRMMEELLGHDEESMMMGHHLPELMDSFLERVEASVAPKAVGVVRRKSAKGEAPK